MPVKQYDVLIEKIKDWNTNLEYFKKIVDRDDCTQNEKQRLEKTIDKINQLSLEIKKKFDSSVNWSHADQVNAQKFKKDFVNKTQIYTNLLRQYKDRKTSELSQARQSYSQRRSTMQRKHDDDDEQSEQGVQIQLQDVNQETLFQEHMIQLKEKQLLEVKSKMEEALKVQVEVGKLVKEQGEKIDIIEDNVDTARSNVKEAGNLLEEGVQHHKSANRKKMCIIGIIFLALLIIIIPIMIKVLI